MRLLPHAPSALAATARMIPVRIPVTPFSDSVGYLLLSLRAPIHHGNDEGPRALLQAHCRAGRFVTETFLVRFSVVEAETAASGGQASAPVITRPPGI